MFKEANTGTNLPAQIELYATPGNEYHFLFIAKGNPSVVANMFLWIVKQCVFDCWCLLWFCSGGGSANKSFLFQQTKAVLNEEKLLNFLNEKIKVKQICR